MELLSQIHLEKKKNILLFYIVKLLYWSVNDFIFFP